MAKSPDTTEPVGEAPAQPAPLAASPAARPLLPRSGRARRRPEMLRIGGSIRPLPFVGLAAVMFILLLGLWWLLSATHAVKPLFLPSPSSVWHTFRGQI